uniref:Uncharacterized protein n=1 Tax=Chromera velia CCMP2878 TaxID=1169474 RepID=A0A0G4HC43_9ALVE|eukprot:Cvel_6227.t1-p1 / transcript=Cvel_6227.t1 / gene=Cvel_6227 / organism=Chromera_velia_CCMP2878 / gene_product=Adventurous-gliding motility protein Z, putative / transcript_product=Adventurous-gliding motility protein Z, putative / location=Cvel_scaffold301:41149-46739(-) / protein_length=656 / sequence_SO=supercontig / SO=protein_coding / is_pseudo=false
MAVEGSPSVPSVLYEEDLRVEEEAIQFLKAQTELVDRLKAENEKNQTLIASLYKQLEQQRARNTELADLQQELRWLEERAKQQEDQRAEKEGRNAAKIEHLEGALTRTRREAEELGQQVQDRDERIRELATEIKGFRDFLRKAESTQREAERRVKAAEEMKVQAVAEARERAAAAEEKALQRIQDTEAVASGHEEECRRLVGLLESARKDVQQRSYSLSMSQEKCEILQKSLEESERKRQEALTALATTRSDLQRSAEEAAELHEKLSSFEEDSAKLQAQQQNHREEVDGLKRAHAETEMAVRQESRGWQTRCEILEQELLRCWEEVRRLQAEENEARRAHERFLLRRREILQRRTAAETHLNHALSTALKTAASPVPSPRRPLSPQPSASRTAPLPHGSTWGGGARGERPLSAGGARGVGHRGSLLSPPPSVPAPVFATAFPSLSASPLHSPLRPNGTAHPPVSVPSGRETERQNAVQAEVTGAFLFGDGIPSVSAPPPVSGLSVSVKAVSREALESLYERAATTSQGAPPQPQAGAGPAPDAAAEALEGGGGKGEREAVGGTTSRVEREKEREGFTISSGEDSGQMLQGGDGGRVSGGVQSAAKGRDRDWLYERGEMDEREGGRNREKERGGARGHVQGEREEDGRGGGGGFKV